MHRAPVRLFGTASAAKPSLSSLATPPSATLPFTVPTATSRKTTTLNNGIRVVTQDTTSSLASVGVFLLGGSRFEGARQGGLAQGLARSLLRSNDSGASELKVTRALEAHGGQVSVSAQRDTVQAVAASFKSEGAVYAKALVAGMTGPKLEAAEFNEAVASYEDPADARAQLVDSLFEAAYGRSGLGNRTNPPASVLKARTAEDLQSYWKKVSTGAGLVVSATGIPHEELVKIVTDNVSKEFAPADRAPLKVPSSPYVGGVSHGLSGADGLTHAGIAFEAPSASSPDLYVASVFASLLGGGNSFSEGGPGKGMHTHLYRSVLCAYPWVESAKADVYPSLDSGLFTITGSAPSEHAGKLIAAMASSAAVFAKREVDADLLAIGKNILCTKIAQQYDGEKLAETNAISAIYNDNLTVQDHIAKIQAVTAKDVQAFAKKTFAGKPTFVTIGEAQSIPTIDQVKAYFA